MRRGRGHVENGHRPVFLSGRRGRRRRRFAAHHQRGVLAERAHRARVLLPELRRTGAATAGHAAAAACGHVRPVVGPRGDSVPRALLRRRRRFQQHVLQRARARAPVAPVSQETVGPRFRRRDRAGVSAGDARRPILPRQAVAARSTPGPQYVRADLGPLPAAERHFARGCAVQDPKPYTAVRTPARTAHQTHLSDGRPGRPAQHTHVLRRVDQLRAGRPTEPQFHGRVRGPRDRFDGVQVAGGVQADQKPRGGNLVDGVVIPQPIEQPVGMRIRMPRAERLH